MKVEEIMHRKVETCTPQSSLAAAAQMMERCDCGAIPVVDENSGKLMGIITDRDITIRAVAKGQDPTSMRVADCMTSDVACVRPDMDIEDCLNLMENKQVRRMPVADSDGQICGIVSQADIAEKLDGSKTAELVREVSESHDLGQSQGMYH